MIVSPANTKAISLEPGPISREKEACRHEKNEEYGIRHSSFGIAIRQINLFPFPLLSTTRNH